MTAVHLKVCDDELLSRSKSGAIWARIYFDLDNRSFPEQGWSDLALAITVAWLEALQKVSEGAAVETKVFFMDGPAHVQISFAQTGIAKLDFIHREIVKHSLVANLDALLRDGILAGQALLALCQRHGWIGDSDYRHLNDSISRAVKSLPS